MVMTCVSGMGDALRDRLPALWRCIEEAHYSYLETDDSPEKLQQRKKLEGFIIEYLSLVPHSCKFGLLETGVVFHRSISSLPDWSAYRAGLGWAALARYAANLLRQPWRTEYRVVRLYSGYFKHEVEANLVGAETLLHAMGYRPRGAGKMALTAPPCPDTVAAVSRDAIIAQTECQIMCQIWESVWSSGARVSWADVCRERATHAASPAAAADNLAARINRTTYLDGPDIYSNVPVTVSDNRVDPRYTTNVQCHHMCEEPIDDPITPVIHPYMVSGMVPSMMYRIPEVTVPNTVSMMPPYGGPYYYPVQAPYMIPTPVYAPIKHANTVPINGYPEHYRYPLVPAVPTAQLIELDSPLVYENGTHRDEERHRKRYGESSRRNSTSKSGFSDVTLPSLPRSDTQPVLSKAREDGMGTYESWDYVFRNLSSKDEVNKSRGSPSLDRDSRTLERLDREERRTKFHQTTLDLEDGLQALNLDRSYDEEIYRTAKVNENLMRLKKEEELKKAKHLRRAEAKKKIEPVPNPPADALITQKVSPDKVKLLTKKDVKDRREILKQVNGVSNAVEARRVKKPVKSVAVEVEKKRPIENGHSHSVAHSSISTSSHQNHELKAQLIVSLDEMDARTNGERPSSRASGAAHKWECATCTYLNPGTAQACEMCGKSRKSPEIQPLTSGGRECPVCTLVNSREARVCDACGTSLEHCPTYI